jgi:hypothetical protein
MSFDVGIHFYMDVIIKRDNVVALAFFMRIYRFGDRHYLEKAVEANSERCVLKLLEAYPEWCSF